MKYFILFAHPEPHLSFQASLLRHGVKRLRDAGHEVIVSNLYEMNFNPVASAADFAVRKTPDRLQYDREQKFSALRGSLPADVQAELEKILWCDAFILQFPLYWFSMPAMMKGWFDRVFVNSIVYGAGLRYESGGLAGRRAMICTSTGAYDSMFAPDGLLGDLEVALWHIHNGTLFYSGFEVAPPFVAWAPVHNGQDACDAYLEDYAERLLGIADVAPLPFHPKTDFGEDFRMLPQVAPRTAGHSRRPR